MPKLPPLLPYETFVRVIRLAKFDGITVLVMGGIFALLAAAAGDFSSAFVGLLVAGAGALELHGAALLERNSIRGINWLINSQLFLLFTILAYCAIMVVNVEVPPIPELAAPVIDLSAERFNMTREEYLRFIQRLVYMIFAALSCLYQGGMAAYYYRRRETVRRALREE
jgi:hypothetical protein